MRFSKTYMHLEAITTLIYKYAFGMQHKKITVNYKKRHGTFTIRVKFAYFLLHALYFKHVGVFYVAWVQFRLFLYIDRSTAVNCASLAKNLG